MSPLVRLLPSLSYAFGFISAPKEPNHLCDCAVKSQIRNIMNSHDHPSACRAFPSSSFPPLCVKCPISPLCIFCLDAVPQGDSTSAFLVGAGLNTGGKSFLKHCSTHWQLLICSMNAIKYCLLLSRLSGFPRRTHLPTSPRPRTPRPFHGLCHRRYMILLPFPGLTFISSQYDVNYM